MRRAWWAVIPVVLLLSACGTPAPTTAPAQDAFARTLNLEVGSPDFEVAWAEGNAVCAQVRAGMAWEDVVMLPYSAQLIGASLGAICPADAPPMYQNIAP